MKRSKRRRSKKEVSSRALTTLAIIAVVLAIGSITVSYQGFNRINEWAGAASQQFGMINVSITSAADISLRNDTINFTATSLNANRDAAVSTDCESGGVSYAAGVGCPINLTNDGSVNIDVDLQTIDDLFTGTTDASSFLCRNNNSGFQTANTYENNTDCRNSAGTITDFIKNLANTDGADSALIYVNITVPADEDAGFKGALLQLDASQT